MDRLDTDILIVGGGFAGAATAFHLSHLTQRSILLVEKERIPGFHASGRNASLLMQSAENRAIRRLLVRSRQAYLSESETAACLSNSGSLLLGSKEQLEAVREPDILPSRFFEPDQARQIVPLLDGHDFPLALSTPSDAVVDISALLAFYLKKAQERGVVVRMDCQVEEIRAGERFRVRTSQGEISAFQLLNAAGAWAPEVATMAGAASLPLTPRKRHLFVLGEVAEVNRDWPFVWSLARNFYFRPESGNLLFSICDEQESRNLEPSVDSEVVESLAELIWRELPNFQDVVQRKAWSCFRTKTPDGNFVIGPDPVLQNFFWAAGLGGHGMGSSWEAGRLAATRLLGIEDPGHDAFDPSRFPQAAR